MFPYAPSKTLKTRNTAIPKYTQLVTLGMFCVCVCMCPPSAPQLPLAPTELEPSYYKDCRWKLAYMATSGTFTFVQINVHCPVKKT